MLIIPKESLNKFNKIIICTENDMLNLPNDERINIFKYKISDMITKIIISDINILIRYFY